MSDPTPRPSQPPLSIAPPHTPAPDTPYPDTPQPPEEPAHQSLPPPPPSQPVKPARPVRSSPRLLVEKDDEDPNGQHVEKTVSAAPGKKSRRKSQPPPPARAHRPAVAESVEVWFDGYDQFYAGKVQSHGANGRSFNVILDDGTFWDIDCVKHVWRRAGAETDRDTDADADADPDAARGGDKEAEDDAAKDKHRDVVVEEAVVDKEPVEKLEGKKSAEEDAVAKEPIVAQLADKIVDKEQHDATPPVTKDPAKPEEPSSPTPPSAPVPDDKPKPDPQPQVSVPPNDPPAPEKTPSDPQPAPKSPPAAPKPPDVAATTTPPADPPVIKEKTVAALAPAEKQTVPPPKTSPSLPRDKPPRKEVSPAPPPEPVEKQIAKTPPGIPQDTTATPTIRRPGRALRKSASNARRPDSPPVRKRPSISREVKTSPRPRRTRRTDSAIEAPPQVTPARRTRARKRISSDEDSDAVPNSVKRQRRVSNPGSSPTTPERITRSGARMRDVDSETVPVPAPAVSPRQRARSAKAREEDVMDKLSTKAVTAIAVDAALASARAVLKPLNDRLNQLVNELETISDTARLATVALSAPQASQNKRGRPKRIVASANATSAALAGLQGDIAEIISGGKPKTSSALTTDDFDALHRAIEYQGKVLRSLEQLVRAAHDVRKKDEQSQGRAAVTIDEGNTTKST